MLPIFTNVNDVASETSVTGDCYYYFLFELPELLYRTSEYIYRSEHNKHVVEFV